MIDFETSARRIAITKEYEEKKKERLNEECKRLYTGDDFYETKKNFNEFLDMKADDPEYANLINEYREARAAVERINLRDQNSINRPDIYATLDKMAPYAEKEIELKEAILVKRFKEIEDEENIKLEKALKAAEC